MHSVCAVIDPPPLIHPKFALPVNSIFPLVPTARHKTTATVNMQLLPKKLIMMLHQLPQHRVRYHFKRMHDDTLLPLVAPLLFCFSLRARITRNRVLPFVETSLDAEITLCDVFTVRVSLRWLTYQPEGMSCRDRNKKNLHVDL